VIVMVTTMCAYPRVCMCWHVRECTRAIAINREREIKKRERRRVVMRDSNGDNAVRVPMGVYALAGVYTRHWGKSRERESHRPHHRRLHDFHCHKEHIHATCHWGKSREREREEGEREREGGACCVMIIVTTMCAHPWVCIMRWHVRECTRAIGGNPEREREGGS